MLDQRSILVIDDDSDYCCLLQSAFREAHVDNPIEVTSDGWTAINSLRRLASTGEPALVLLDLLLPRLSGVEVLRWIRSQPRLDNVPIVVFTGLEGGEETSKARALGAASLRVKPFSYHDLVQEVKKLQELYLRPQELKHAA
jgi:DNA-binding response OmpR family regulator